MRKLFIRLLVVALIGIFGISAGFSQTVVELAPKEAANEKTYKHEFRAPWIASVSNIDWPKAAHKLNYEAQKADLIAMLDHYKSINMNAIVLQVRPECDALYNSAYEPWSRYLGGIQGTVPTYDPLAFAIEQGHKRGIEVHAWMNPYRLNASTYDDGNYYHETHIYREHPEWALEYPSGKNILNPGLPEVQTYIGEVVRDMVKNYDLDGVHFDDYFYAYEGTPTLLDSAAFADYGQEFIGTSDPRGNFRRASVNKMVKAVYNAIQDQKPWVRFGVSPFGIYGNGTNPPGISGMDAYNSIYCDPVAWMSEGTVDYITPQLYWTTGGSQDYATLAPFWADTSAHYNRHFYPGQGTYRLSDNPTSKKQTLLAQFWSGIKSVLSKKTKSTNGFTLAEINLQIQINRDAGALGSIFFSGKDFFRVNGLSESIMDMYGNKALVPIITWKGGTAPAVPTNLRIEQTDNKKTVLRWDAVSGARKYAIYLYPSSESTGNIITDIAAPKNLFAVVYANEVEVLPDTSEPHILLITALDPYGYESEPVMYANEELPGGVGLVLPTMNQGVGNIFFFEWQQVNNAFAYTLEISTSPTFIENLMKIEGISSTTYDPTGLLLAGETTYFWRVVGAGLSGSGVYSDVWSFETKYPTKPVLLTPANGETGSSTLPQFSWQASSVTSQVLLQVSKASTGFTETSTIINSWLSADAVFNVSAELYEYTTYYVRLKARNEFGETEFSEISSFKTMLQPPGKMVFVNPQNQADGLEQPLQVIWENTDGATSYLIQVSTDANFGFITEEQTVFLKNNTQLTHLIHNMRYFMKGQAHNIGGSGEWSNVVEFVIGQANLVNEYSLNEVNMEVLYVNVPDKSKIKILLPKGGHAKIDLYDVLGQRKNVLADKTFQAGESFVDLTTALPKGVFFLKLNYEGFKTTQKFINFVD